MSQPFKFTHLRPIVGLFVLGSTILVFSVLVIAVRGRHWFENTFTISARFGKESEGRLIRTGTAVQIQSLKAGEVVDTRLEDGQVVVKMLIRETFHDVVREDSQVIMKSPALGVVGESYIEIIPGSKQFKRLEDGAVVQGKPEASLLAQVEEVLNALERHIGPTLADLERLLKNINTLIEKTNEANFQEEVTALLAGANKNDMTKHFSAFLEEHARLMKTVNDRQLVEKHIERTLDKMHESVATVSRTLRKLEQRIDKGEGLLGRTLTNEAFSQDWADAIHGISEAAQEIKVVAYNLKASSTLLPGVARKIDRAAQSIADVSRELAIMAPEIPAITHSLDEVLFESGVIMGALERHWLLRKYVIPTEYGLIQPTGIADSAAAEQVRRMRHQLLRTPTDQDSGRPPVTQSDAGAPKDQEKGKEKEQDNDKRRPAVADSPEGTEP